VAALVVGQGTQFITGPCTSDADCASACCGFNSGKCAGPIVAQERDGGCGFGDAQPNANAANALLGKASTSPTSTSAAVAAVQISTSTPSATPGKQFITGPCTSDADCASACCGFNSGKCAGPIVAQERDGGCGFGDAQPNANAANALLGKASTSPTSTSAAVAAVQTPTSTSSAAPGKQFITGPCTSDADCASSCCGFHSGKCAGPIIAQERDGGCGFGDAQPNAIAAKALGFTGKKRGLRFSA
jgi:hypothetical protein